jgi:hypothetical protein
MDRRKLTFFLGCIPFRLGLVVLAYFLPLKYLPIFGYLALLPAIGFLGQYVLGLRKTGKGFAGGEIWWTQLRPIHGALYLVFALYAIQKQRFAWIVLLVDALLGFGAGLYNNTRM